MAVTTGRAAGLLGLALALVATGAGQAPAAAEASTPIAHATRSVDAEGDANSTVSASQCPSTSGRSYAQGPVQQWDGDNPVRPAQAHADKNLELRGYSRVSAAKSFVNYGSDDSNQPPQLATLFNPHRVPTFSNVFNAGAWEWAESPDPGSRAGPIDAPWPVTVMGLGTTPGEELGTPASGYDIGGGQEAVVLYADEGRITLKYTREDSVGSGYTLHVDGVCVDPNLLALYNALDDPAGPRYVFAGGPGGGHWYDLPTLSAGQVFGTARESEIRVSTVDTGSFMDPRSCDDWWQIRPGATCP